MVEEPFHGDFDADVPAAVREDILQRSIERAWDLPGADPEISFTDMVRHDVLNIEFTGTILIDGREHAFHIRDGNRNGTEIISWNGVDAISHEPAPERALVPFRMDVDAALAAAARNAPMALLQRWDQDLDPGTERGAILSRLPAAAVYDAYFAPGSSAAQAHERRAREFGYEIGCADEARGLRKKLVRATLRLRPADRDWLEGPASAIRETFARWSALQDPASDAATPAGLILDGIAERQSRTTGLRVSLDDQIAMRAHGFDIATRNGEISAWREGLMTLYTLPRIEGFNPRDLPEDPILSMLDTLEPGHLRSTKVDAEKVALRTHLSAINYMAVESVVEIPDRYRQCLARVGYQPIERQGDIERSPGVDEPTLTGF